MNVPGSFAASAESCVTDTVDKEGEAQGKAELATRNDAKLFCGIRRGSPSVTERGDGQAVSFCLIHTTDAQLCGEHHGAVASQGLLLDADAMAPSVDGCGRLGRIARKDEPEDAAARFTARRCAVMRYGSVHLDDGCPAVAALGPADRVLGRLRYCCRRKGSRWFSPPGVVRAPLMQPIFHMVNLEKEELLSRRPSFLF